MSSTETAMVVSVAIVIVTGLAAVGIAWIVARLERRRLDARQEVRRSLVGQISSADDLREILLAGGGRLLDSARETPRERAVRAVERGIVVLFVGLGLSGVGVAMDEALAVAAGALAISGGTGLLVGAWVSHRMSRGGDREDAA